MIPIENRRRNLARAAALGARSRATPRRSRNFMVWLQRMQGTGANLPTG